MKSVRFFTTVITILLALIMDYWDSFQKLHLNRGDGFSGIIGTTQQYYEKYIYKYCAR